MKKAKVAIIMGSKSDLGVMGAAKERLEKFGVPCEVKVVSAHRTPEAMLTYAKEADSRGIQVIIAGAGGAAHLPGMVASITSLPVIGVPVQSKNSLHGIDSILSILQMPPGVPVATAALNAAENAAILATQILALSDSVLRERLVKFKEELRDHVAKQNTDISEK